MDFLSFFLFACFKNLHCVRIKILTFISVFQATIWNHIESRFFFLMVINFVKLSKLLL